MDRASIEHRAAEAALASARLESKTRRIELLRALGWPEHSTDFTATGGLEGTGRSDGPSETEVIERAALVRLDVAAAEQRVLAEEANARLQGWRRLPEVGVMVEAMETAGGRTSVAPGGTVTIPILDDGSAAIAKASARVEQARLTAAITRENAIEEARSALNRWERARQQVTLFEDGLVSSARDVVKRSELSFKAGISDATSCPHPEKDDRTGGRILRGEAFRIAGLVEQNAVGGCSTCRSKDRPRGGAAHEPEDVAGRPRG